jgi:hypothetical protein
MLKTGPLYGQYDNEKGNEHTEKLNKMTRLLSAVKLTCTLPTDHIQYNSGIFCVQILIVLCPMVLFIFLLVMLSAIVRKQLLKTSAIFVDYKYSQC